MDSSTLGCEAEDTPERLDFQRLDTRYFLKMRSLAVST